MPPPQQHPRRRIELSAVPDASPCHLTESGNHDYNEYHTKGSHMTVARDQIITIPLSLTNSYLIDGDQGSLLVDCGRKEDEALFLRRLHGLGRSLASIRWLFLTHHHSDHCGLLPFLVRQNPDIQVFMSKTCAEYLMSGVHFHPHEERFASKALGLAFGWYSNVSGTLRDTFEPYQIREEDWLFDQPDQALPDCTGIKGRILLTPGHTPDSSSLILRSHACVGDAARNILGFLGAPHLPILLYDEKLCRESWNHLRSMHVELIFPGHGRRIPMEHLMGTFYETR